MDSEDFRRELVRRTHRVDYGALYRYLLFGFPPVGLRLFWEDYYSAYRHWASGGPGSGHVVVTCVFPSGRRLVSWANRLTMRSSCPNSRDCCLHLDGIAQRSMVMKSKPCVAVLTFMAHHVCDGSSSLLDWVSSLLRSSSGSAIDYLELRVAEWVPKEQWIAWCIRQENELTRSPSWQDGDAWFGPLPFRSTV
ncbi:hypothetical protein N657DRAFT_490308 [Parathielavia appendiculata]|uniref:Uncharacterized protein n=1 Tax=Parathielavia appendiculata TaxID=2587402 RepID=A0AAN6TNY4_9PEZI|nr:hypothetical protein N657DRAFT_490308 [Parathielavia appendiculata]